MTKRTRPSKKSKNGFDVTEKTPKQKGNQNSLLDFVSALDDMDVPDEAEHFETFADLDMKMTEKKKTKNPKKETIRDDVDVNDFTDVLDNDDSGFTGLKKKIAVIQGGNSDGPSAKVLSAPLPTFQQSEIDRTVAYDKTVKDVSKWAPIIQKNREAESLVFPLKNSESAQGVSSHSLVSSFAPVTDMEKEISGLIQRDGITPKVNASDSTVALEADSLPTIHLDPDQVYRELSRARSSRFFAEIKAKRQAKIKSKKYRKMLAKERMRAEAEAIASGNLGELARLGLAASTADDEEMRRERRMKAEMERARERLTLKTRKVNKWAHELLTRKHGDADGRLRVLEQVREKERLRQEIYGVSDKFDDSDDSEDSDEETAEGSDVQADDDDQMEQVQDEASAEVQDIFDQVKAEHAVVTGRHKFGPSEGGAVQVKADATSDDESDQEFNSEINEKIVKRSQKGPSSTTKVSVEDQSMIHDDGDDADDGNNMTEIAWKSQSDLVREAFAEDDVFAEFASEKQAIIEAEAPKVEDVTLPGWGVWGGVGISEEQSKSKNRWVLHKKGLDPKARLDKDLKHVIINERRIKAAAKAFTVPSVPFPFNSAEEHARHIAQPIGKEWNTVTSFRKRIQPKVVTKAGSIIKPIKFFKQQRNI